ncbi:MAG: Fimbrial protein pilin [Francisellaceae bacterium]|nr:Fimbrial protein pilin [Francisellaceae bacterium]
MRLTFKGFSLIELMIVIAIIGILAVVAIPNYQSYVKKSQIAEAIGILESTKTQMMESYNSTGNCPSSLKVGDLTVPPSNGSITVPIPGVNSIQNLVYGICTLGNCSASTTCSTPPCKCVAGAILSNNLGGGFLVIALLPPASSSNTYSFTCGLWSSAAPFAGTSLPYLPSSCNGTNINTL